MGSLLFDGRPALSQIERSCELYQNATSCARFLHNLFTNVRYIREATYNLSTQTKLQNGQVAQRVAPSPKSSTNKRS